MEKKKIINEKKKLYKFMSISLRFFLYNYFPLSMPVLPFSSLVIIISFETQK